MSLLTAKALDHFIKWMQENNDILSATHYPILKLDDLHEGILKDYLIEWLDSVGIYIQVGAISTNGIPIFDYNIQEDNTINGMNGHHFGTRQQATTEAIKQANIIYNNR